MADKKNFLVLWLCAFVLAFLCTPIAIFAAAIVEPVTGISFPSEVQFSEGSEDFTLRITGATVRKKWIFKVYGVAHYAGAGDRSAKQLTIQYVRTVSAKKMREALRHDFMLNVPTKDYPKIRKYVDQVLDYFQQPVRKGDVFIMRWLPGGRVLFELNQEELGAVESELFARSLWAIWFGRHPVVDPRALMGESSREAI